MGVLSDRQIKERCLTPTHVIRDAHNACWTTVTTNPTISKQMLDKWADTDSRGVRKIHGQEDLDRYGWKPMITPFSPEANRFNEKGTKIISWGLSSYGYDIRIKSEGVKLFTNINGQAIDPMRPYGEQLADPIIHFDEEFDLYYFFLPPNSVALAHTVEWFNIPRDVLVICLGKSTYARVGLTQLMTPLEPEWEGELVLEIASMTNLPTRVYLNCGVAQLVFLKGDEVCEVSYKDKGGKYQGQLGTQLAKL